MCGRTSACRIAKVAIGRGPPEISKFSLGFHIPQTVQRGSSAYFLPQVRPAASIGRRINVDQLAIDRLPGCTNHPWPGGMRLFSASQDRLNFPAVFGRRLLNYLFTLRIQQMDWKLSTNRQVEKRNCGLADFSGELVGSLLWMFSGGRYACSVNSSACLNSAIIWSTWRRHTCIRATLIDKQDQDMPLLGSCRADHCSVRPQPHGPGFEGSISLAGGICYTCLAPRV